MNAMIQRINLLLLEFSNSPKGNPLNNVRIWEDFCSEVRQIKPNVDDVIEAFDWMILNQDWGVGEPLLVMAWPIRDLRVASRICSIIDTGHPAAPIENAIGLLEDMGFCESVPTLIRATGLRFGYDPTNQIPIKALQALREIGDQKALDYLRHVSSGEDELLATEASALLADSSNKER